ncbi:MATE family efflux transporter [Sulfitobacter pseudonitzschiae]|uniref:Multidrug export protein MepA n=1 Tax=Pseudosulfitobacter pseudonitzschiae TaxID=1402135 RepID=A0A9Q2NMA6_9RHOB|nr:MATE family efflux transporter [Pseudosulfitobacter pseudonitzschiae]MBM2292617.1 MATE family efflux transporter [Pseudosulfitobacter pseudonitzschiae]MBM2297534.1 MATE family efflux transporter [Pseudosulfitobacter pseudonitzschiae]MBM2302448.1 MATE family efflux transporter [Pseudosulfitobacter pseudonitzschiae]MBM2312231.1 MATE family efflux transporter [Pseudosulfitobacter pseudonitzschiae]MBM2317144.1 MATE family efflux transporter [Pseudosulfitobacter pseudonitzschiae]
MSDAPASNIFTSGPLLPLFLRTAAPIILVMGVNGAFAVVDAYFLGVFVGARAVIAVTLMFPLYMMLVALSTLVSSGFSALYAQALGAGDGPRGQALLGSALQLAMLVSLVLMALFVAFGTPLAIRIAAGDIGLAQTGHLYLEILVFGSPLGFLVGIGVDALRAQGWMSAMAGIMLMAALLNIAFDALFVVWIGLGVPGSAFGTLLSQLCAGLVVLAVRRGQPPVALWPLKPMHWGRLLAWGAPSSLGYIGLSLSAAVTLVAIQLWGGAQFNAIAGAFGIISRLMTFAFLPLLGLSMAFQTITANVYGAGQDERVQAALRVAVVLGLVYGAVVQAIYLLGASWLGAVFVDEPQIVAQVARILPITTATMFLFGPLMMVATHFQAIGDAPRAGLLGLSRTYLFGLPLTLLLPLVWGEVGIWLAGPVAECLVLGLTVWVLWRRRG